MGVQVQSATKNGQGESLSILNRQFISFSYGGKNIEDFDLLAVFSNDRLDKGVYSSFNDITTEQAELDGQMFWRSNFKAGELNFTLATDGMTSAQLENFKNWFKPGIERELILSEYSNRGILARVSEVPQMSLLPFEQEVEVLIGDEKKISKISLYKGDISLSFTMDDPYWYSLKSFLTTLEKEDVKIIYEDGIPYLSMLKTKCFLADNYYCGYKDIGVSNSLSIFENKGISLSGNSQEDTYLYYCGTAPASPIISFEIKPVINEVNGKISFPNKDSEDYIYLSIGSAENYKKLFFSLPSLFSSYNNALDIVLKYQENSSILDLRKELRDFVYDYYTRSYVIALIDIAKNNRDYTTIEGALKDNFRNFFIEEMKKFFIGNLFCDINCKTGAVQISGKIKQYNGSEMIEVPEPIIENAGNMIKSNYLTIETRTLPVNGKINAIDCLLVKTNSELFNLKINYKYMYL